MTEEKKQSIHIPESIIAELENENKSDSTADPGKTDKDLELIQKSVGVALENVNHFLKQKGLPGWDESETDSITKLGVIVAKKRLPKDIFSNSPEFILGLALTSIVVENVLAYRELQPTKPAGGNNDSEK